MKTIILFLLLSITLVISAKEKDDPKIPAPQIKIEYTIEEELKIEPWMLNDTIFVRKDSIK